MNLGRLNTDGSLDPTNRLNGDLSALTVLADGKILVASSVTTLGGQTRTNSARLNADGNIDLTFNPGMFAAKKQALLPV